MPCEREQAKSFGGKLLSDAPDVINTPHFHLEYIFQCTLPTMVIFKESSVGLKDLEITTLKIFYAETGHKHSEQDILKKKSLL